MISKTVEVKRTKDFLKRSVLVTTYKFLGIPIYVSKVVNP